MTLFTPLERDLESAVESAIEDAKEDFVAKVSAAWTAIGLNVDEQLLELEIRDVLLAAYVRLHDRRQHEIYLLKRGSRRP